MKKFFLTHWHGFWYKWYHLPRSTDYLVLSPDKNKISIRPDKQAYHNHHFKKMWYHGQEYQKLDPKGMTKFSERTMAKAFPKS